MKDFKEMKWWEKILIGFGAYVWALPINILTIPLSWLMVLFGQLKFVRYHYPIFEFKTVEGSLLHEKIYAGKWAGGSLSCANWFHYDYIDSEKTIKHERRHSFQTCCLGILMPIVYFSHSLIIYFFQKHKHSYVDNIFERDSRHFAGQEVNVDWRKWYGEDRWAWW